MVKIPSGVKAHDAAMIRSQAIKDFCESAGMRASEVVKHLPDDVRRFRAQAALDSKIALRALKGDE